MTFSETTCATEETETCIVTTESECVEEADTVTETSCQTGEIE